MSLVIEVLLKITIIDLKVSHACLAKRDDTSCETTRI